MISFLRKERIPKKKKNETQLEIEPRTLYFRCTVGDNGRSGDSSLGYLPEALLLSRIIKEDLLFSSVGGWSLVHSIIL